MSTENTDEIQKKIYESASFYKNYLNIDNRLAEYGLQTIQPYFQGSTCLEIGPANGIVTRHLVKLFKQVDVVEASATLLATIPDYPNLRKFHALIEQFRADTAYDTIVMSHVLEHIKDSQKALINIRRYIKRNGRFIVSVPNAKSIHRLVAVKMGLLSSEYQLNERDYALGHYRVYDSQLLRQHLEEAGFSIIKQGGYFLKPVSNAQIEEHWTPEMIEGFYKASDYLPEYCAEIFAVCTPAQV